MSSFATAMETCGHTQWEVFAELLPLLDLLLFDIKQRDPVRHLDHTGLDNTLILFHSDNGGTKNAMFAGQMTDLSKTVLPCDNGPYRDGKGSLFEGGSRGFSRRLSGGRGGRGCTAPGETANDSDDRQEGS
mgnify:CR=1 FL=1